MSASSLGSAREKSTTREGSNLLATWVNKSQREVWRGTVPTRGRLNSRFLEKEVVKVVNRDGDLNLYDPKLGRRGRD